MQRLGRANRLESWHETCLSCTLPARFTRDPPGGRVSFVGERPLDFTDEVARRQNGALRPTGTRFAVLASA